MKHTTQDPGPAPDDNIVIGVSLLFPCTHGTSVANTRTRDRIEATKKALARIHRYYDHPWQPDSPSSGTQAEVLKGWLQGTEGSVERPVPFSNCKDRHFVPAHPQLHLNCLLSLEDKTPPIRGLSHHRKQKLHMGGKFKE